MQGTHAGLGRSKTQSPSQTNLGPRFVTEERAATHDRVHQTCNGAFWPVPSVVLVWLRHWESLSGKIFGLFCWKVQANHRRAQSPCLRPTPPIPPSPQLSSLQLQGGNTGGVNIGNWVSTNAQAGRESPLQPTHAASCSRDWTRHTAPGYRPIT